MELRDALTRYLERVFGEPIPDVSVAPLDGGALDDVKGFGYGVPLAVRCLVGGARREVVLARTRPVPGFSRDYPADRAWQAFFSHGTYNAFPRHARSLDVGIVRASAVLTRVADAPKHDASSSIPTPSTC